MNKSEILILLCNIIPAFIILYYLVKGWVKGGLFMIISAVRLFGTFILTRIISDYLTNYLMSYSQIKDQLLTFVLNNKDTFNHIPGASVLLLGRVINNNIETIAWWILYFLCFIVIFIFLMIIFYLILKLTINFNKIPILGLVNKFIGSILGLIIGLFLTLLLIYFLSFLFNIFGEEEIAQNLLASWLPVLFRTLV